MRRMSHSLYKAAKSILTNINAPAVFLELAGARRATLPLSPDARLSIHPTLTPKLIIALAASPAYSFNPSWL